MVRREIILNLLSRGAELRKTEATSLLREEYKRIIKLAQSKSAAERTIAYVKYKLRKGQLTKARDKFVARMIDETLKEGETGVLFMGSYHNVLPYLPEDIVVEQVKDREKINAYFKELVSKGDAERFEQLSTYLASSCLS